MKLFWCRWAVPNNIDRRHIVGEWPENIQGWITGKTSESDAAIDGGFVHWEGGVIAPSPLHAWRKVLSCYGPSRTIIVQRALPEEKPADFDPGDNFPGYNLKLPRTETVAFEKPEVPPTNEK